MLITFISLSTPTPFNCRAASALPYHLAMYRDQDVELEIYSFNFNGIPEDQIIESSKALNAKITVVPMPKWYGLMFSLHLGFLRAVLRYPVLRYLQLSGAVVDKIKASHPDRIWIYGEELSHLATKFPYTPCVVTTPDCEALYYRRELERMGQGSSAMKRFKYSLMYRKYARMAASFPTENVKYHLVGQEDCDYLRQLNPAADATFINHPHYDYSDRKAIRFAQPRIKILVAGRYDIYMKDECDRLFTAMIAASGDLRDHFKITFLGKDWDCWCREFADAGFEAEHIRFAPDYVQELTSHDIQITPIGVGTGTKGKVLDAFANGLMVIGTLRALENIQVVPGESCILYQDPCEVISVLKDMVCNPTKYEAIAENGRNAVLSQHSRERVSRQVFNLFK